MAKLIECPHCGGNLEGAADGRATWWRYRVRLYDLHMPGPARDPIADSASGHHPDAPGVDTGRGTRNILGLMAVEAVEFHGGEMLLGMGGTDLDTKERGIRSTIYRNKTHARITVPYDTRASYSEAPDHKPRYQARLDLLRIPAPQGQAGTDDEAPF